MLDFPSLLYKGLRILMFQLSEVYCILKRGVARLRGPVDAHSVDNMDLLSQAPGS